MLTHELTSYSFKTIINTYKSVAHCNNPFVYFYTFNFLLIEYGFATVEASKVTWNQTV